MAPSLPPSLLPPHTEKKKEEEQRISEKGTLDHASYPYYDKLRLNGRKRRERRDSGSHVDKPRLRLPTVDRGKPRLLDPVEQNICMRLPNACVCVWCLQHTHAHSIRTSHTCFCAGPCSKTTTHDTNPDMGTPRSRTLFPPLTTHNLLLHTHTRTITGCGCPCQGQGGGDGHNPLQLPLSHHHHHHHHYHHHRPPLAAPAPPVAPCWPALPWPRSSLSCVHPPLATRNRPTWAVRRRLAPFMRGP